MLLDDTVTEVIKIESPGAGEDTHGWSPQFLAGVEVAVTGPSANYLSASRGKHADAVNRIELILLIAALTARRSSQVWPVFCEGADIPFGPLNDLVQIFVNPQVAGCSMRIETTLATCEPASPIGDPLKMSQTSVIYDRPPPSLDADTGAVLTRCPSLTGVALTSLAAAGVLGGVLDP